MRDKFLIAKSISPCSSMGLVHERGVVTYWHSISCSSIIGDVSTYIQFKGKRLSIKGCAHVYSFSFFIFQLLQRCCRRRYIWYPKFYSVHTLYSLHSEIPVLKNHTKFRIFSPVLENNQEPGKCIFSSTHFLRILIWQRKKARQLQLFKIATKLQKKNKR